MITLTMFYGCLGLPEFFNFLKFLGQKEPIIPKCARPIDRPRPVNCAAFTICLYLRLRGGSRRSVVEIIE